MDDLPPERPRWPYVMAGLASLVWLVLAFFAMAPLMPLALPAGLEPVAMAAGIVLNFIAPVAILWLVAARLRDHGAARAARLALMDEHSRLMEARLERGAEAIATLETRLSDLTGQLTAMAKPVERQHQALSASLQGLGEAASALETAAGRSEAATSRLGHEMPAASQAAEALAGLLDQSRMSLDNQIRTAETLLATLAQRLAEARTEAGQTGSEAEARIHALRDAVKAAHEQLAGPLAALSEGVDEALARTAEAVDTTRAGVQAQTNAMLASVDQARSTIDLIAEESARAIAARLAQLTGTLEDIDASLGAQAARAGELVETLAGQFRGLDSQLATSAESGQTLLDSLTARLGDTGTALAGLGQPLGDTDAALAALGAQLAGLEAASAQAFGRLGEQVPEGRAGLEDLAQRLAQLEAAAQGLAVPIEAGADSVSGAQGRLENAAAALDVAAEALAERLAGAEASLAAITRNAEDEALAAANQLIDSFGRIRDIANQSAGTMRETLAGVVAEAEAALDRAGTSRAATAFGTPIRTELAALETAQTRAAAAAQRAAERVAERLVQLTATVSDVEAHFDKRQTELDIRDRMDLVKRATQLLTSLQDQAIDLSRLLGLDIDDKAYDEWLAGDRSRFQRHLALGLENGVGRAIMRHLSHDAAFRTDAARYVQDFEALIAHVMQDRQGRTLASTLLASDPGKLYIALAQPEAG